MLVILTLGIGGDAGMPKGLYNDFSPGESKWPCNGHLLLGDMFSTTAPAGGFPPDDRSIDFGRTSCMSNNSGQ